MQISKTFFERLKDASNNGVQIKIIYGKDELKPNERNSLAELKFIELFYFENLHAKCYFNESEMVITSMNMYEFSEKNNREMGVYITKTNDSNIFDKAINETFSIIKSAEIIELKRVERKEVRQKGNSNHGNSNSYHRGYCIRCEERIPFNPDRPYCYDCFSIWSIFENSDYEENVCHSCGEFQTTTMNKPLCYECFKKFSSF